MNYIGLIFKENGSDYGVVFPDFPGCVTAGKTLEEAKNMANEAVKDHVELLREMGSEIPLPSSLDEVMSQKEYKNTVAFVVEIPSRRSVRVNVTFAEDILDLIDRRAHQFHLTRSSFLAEAARRYKRENNKHY